jgi:hypothetical protein
LNTNSNWSRYLRYLPLDADSVNTELIFCFELYKKLPHCLVDIEPLGTYTLSFQGARTGNVYLNWPSLSFALWVKIECEILHQLSQCGIWWYLRRYHHSTLTQFTRCLTLCWLSQYGVSLGVNSWWGMTSYVSWVTAE